MAEYQHGGADMDLTVNNPEVDLVELNNLIVSLRKKTKQAKLFLYRQLEKKKRKLDKKFDKSKNEIKIKRINEEISKLKMWDTDRITKSVLANELSVAQAGPSKDIDSLLIAKISELPVMKAEVARFRSKYSDWKNLAAYLLYKNSSGKFKKNKTQKFGPILQNTGEIFSDMESLGEVSDLDVEDEENNHDTMEKEKEIITCEKLESVVKSTKENLRNETKKTDNFYQSLNMCSQNTTTIASTAPESSDCSSTCKIQVHDTKKSSESSKISTEIKSNNTFKMVEAICKNDSSSLKNENKVQKRFNEDVQDNAARNNEVRKPDASKLEDSGVSKDSCSGGEADNFFTLQSEPLIIENVEDIEADSEFQNDFFCSVKNYKNFKKSCLQKVPTTDTRKKFDVKEKQREAPHRQKRSFLEIKEHQKPQFHRKMEETQRIPPKKRLAPEKCVEEQTAINKISPDMHPSWAAKQKEKEKLLSVKPNMSSKIVFDDSD